MACYEGVGSLLQASFMGSHVIPGFVAVIWVQTGGPGHDQPQPGLLGEDDIQHKHKGRLAVPVHKSTAPCCSDAESSGVFTDFLLSLSLLC